MKPLDPEAFLLLKAADILETRGWIQDKSAGHGGKDPPVCVGKAIQEAAEGCNSLAWDGIRRFERHLGFPHRDSWKEFCPIPNWNDTPGRTKQEVIEALRSAAMPTPERETV